MVTEQCHNLVLAVVLGSLIGTSLDVAEVADVSSLVVRAGMVNFARIVVGACSFAALGQIAELVDVESVQAGSKSGELASDAALGVGARLLKANDRIGSLSWLSAQNAYGFSASSCFHIVR